MRYIIGILQPKTWKELVRSALDAGIIGQPGFTWILAESSSELVSTAFSLSRETEADLATALHGAGVLMINVEPNEPFDEALLTFSESQIQRQQFVSQFQEPELFANYTFSTPGRSLYQYLTYDAVMALGIAACECESDLFTGKELYQRLLLTEFDGVSGRVAFSNETGTRRSDDFSYVIENLVLLEANASSDIFTFQAVSSAVVWQLNQSVEILQPFVYADSTTEQPPCFAPLNEQLNLVSTGACVAGRIVSSLVMMASVGWFVWTMVNRKKDVVRASQPIFLGQLCVGTFVMASAIIPQSLQEPVSKRGLNIACMTAPWLVILGFAISFSALFSKTWRLNKLFNKARGMRRVVLRYRDVMMPFIVFMTLNIAFLAGWTALAPLVWTRVPLANFDVFGRSVESYATCRSESPGQMFAFLGPMIAMNLSALIFAAYQAYKARNLPTQFSESKYMAMTMASLLECLLISAPLFALVADNPTADFLVTSIVISIVCLAILLPIFVPKYIRRRDAAGDDSRAFRGETRASILMSVRRSGGSDLPGQESGRSLRSLFALRRSPTRSQRIMAYGRARVKRSEEYYQQRDRAESSQRSRDASVPSLL